MADTVNTDMEFYQSKYEGSVIEGFLDAATKATQECIEATLGLETLRKIVEACTKSGQAVTETNILQELQREEAFAKMLLRWAELDKQVQEALAAILFQADTVTTSMIVNQAVTNAKLADGSVSYIKLNAELQRDINYVRDTKTWIPDDTAVDNKLVNETQLAEAMQGIGRYLTSDVGGGAFPTYADLHAPYYYAGVVTSPTNNDYVTVLEDETHDNATTRYVRSGSIWSFAFKINDSAFTDAQWAAIDSTITAALVQQIKDNKVNIEDFQELELSFERTEDKVTILLQTQEKADGTRTIDQKMEIPTASVTFAGFMSMADKNYIEDDKTTKLAIEELGEESVTIKKTTDAQIVPEQTLKLPAALGEDKKDASGAVTEARHAGVMTADDKLLLGDVESLELSLVANKTLTFAYEGVTDTLNAITDLNDINSGDYKLTGYVSKASNTRMDLSIENDEKSYTITIYWSDAVRNYFDESGAPKGTGNVISLADEAYNDITIRAKSDNKKIDTQVTLPNADTDNSGVMTADTYKEHEDYKTLAIEQTKSESNVIINAKTTEGYIDATTTLDGADADNAGLMTSQTFKEIEDIKGTTATSESVAGGVSVKIQSNEGYFNAQAVIDNASDGANGMMAKEDKVALDNLKTVDLTAAQTAEKAVVTLKTDGDTIKKVAEIGLTDTANAGLLSPEAKEKYDKALIKDEGGIVSAAVEFTDKVVVLAPTEDMEAATKKYVDENGGKVKEILIQEGAATAGLKEPENKRITLAVPTKTSHLANDGDGVIATDKYSLKSYTDAHDGVNGVSATAAADKVTVKVTTPSAEETTKEAQGDIPGATATSAGVMTAQQVKDLEGKQDDIKIKIVDMEAADFSPVLNTYYQHSYDAATADTYMKGMVYRYRNVTAEKLDPFGQSYDPKQYETVPTMLPIDGSGSGGGGGVSSYNELTNKPQINSVELAGNVTPASLNIPYTDLKADSIPTINGVKVMGQKKADGTNIDGEYYGLADLNDFNDLKQIVEGLGGALVYIGDYISDASEVDLKGGLLSNFVFQETGGAAQNGYLVKVHATTGGFRGEYLYVSNGSSIATWKLYSESESVTPATYTTKGVVQIKENAGLKLTDGVLEAEVTADNDKTFTHKYISGSDEAGNVLRNFDTQIFKDGVKVSVLDDTVTHDQIATAKATWDAFKASGAADIGNKLDKVTYTETESGSNTGIYAHTAEQQKTIPVVTAFPDDVNNSQLPSAKLVKDNLDTKLDKITVATKGVYFHDGATQSEKLIATTIGEGSTDDEIPTAKAAYANQKNKLDSRTNSASEVYTHEGDVQGGKVIVKTLDENSTDEQIPTAKAAYANQADKLTKNETTTPNQAITAANIGAATKLTNNDYVYANYGTTQKNLEMNAIIRTVLETIYPVGAYYISNTNKNPKDILGFGTWTAVVGALYGAGTTNANQMIAGNSSMSTSYTYSVGNVKEALPNITGTVGRDPDYGSGAQSGPFYRGSNGANNCDGNHNRYTVIMDLSRANSIYINNSHVRVGGYCAYIWRRTA